MANWHEALDAQSQAFSFYDSSRGRAYAKGWVSSWDADKQSTENGREHGSVSKEALQMYSRMVSDIPDILLNAETLYVEPEMFTLVESAVPGFELGTLLREDVPVSTGFLYLPRPLTMQDRWGEKVTVRAFAWAPFVPLQGEGQHLALLMLHRVGDTDAYSEKEGSSLGLNPDDLLILHIFPWLFGIDIPEAETPGGFIYAAKPLVVIWRLMQQTIGVTTRERPHRSTRRRVTPKLKDSLVVVVRLRRPKRIPGEKDVLPVDWHFRWIVGGHWRQQWFPRLSLHRQIWISPYIKGPDDKPLASSKTRVFDLAR